MKSACEKNGQSKWSNEMMKIAAELSLSVDNREMKESIKQNELTHNEWKWTNKIYESSGGLFSLKRSSCVCAQIAFICLSLFRSLYRRVATITNLWFCSVLFVFIHFNEFYTSYLPLVLKFTLEKKGVTGEKREPSVNKRIYYTKLSDSLEIWERCLLISMLFSMSYEKHAINAANVRTRSFQKSLLLQVNSKNVKKT